jgi:hypothetical protein
MQPASSVAGAHCTGDDEEMVQQRTCIDGCMVECNGCSARQGRAVMKARNVPKGLVLATPNASADKQ